MQLISTAFRDGDRIPRHYTCEGSDLSPPLGWSEAPQGTQSFALICDDPDAPAGTWHHWALYDLASDCRSLAEGAGAPGRHEFKQAINDFDSPGYGGPCPPHGHGPHNYHFRVLALSVDHLPVRKNATCREVAREAQKHLLEEAILIGWYER